MTKFNLELKILSLVWLACIVLLGAPSNGWTKGATPNEPPCALVSSWDGDVQFLSPDKKQLYSVKSPHPLSCGTWISVRRGIVEAKLKGGIQFHVADRTLIQIQKKQLSVFRGSVFASALNGAEPISLISSIAKAQVDQGEVIFLSNTKDDGSQLVVLRGKASLENRFQSERRINLGEGETSTINFKLHRTAPTPPSAFSVASLRPKLFELKIPIELQNQYIATAIRRQNRKLATLTEPSESEETDSKSSKPGNRKIASEDADVQRELVKRLSGGEAVGEQLLFPENYGEKIQKGRVEVIEQNWSKEELQEKKRLIESLSQIREE